ncbi:hypothetical protein F2Q69_00045926 [Brassica cretica]|uniref:Uncharacterized protein n=1 Tax=Brassica cretica TaxID=69181 RepID=A0A8S9PYH9_BRACR|nr:hypothetical protein F2Q69_00045926 [Brassica cretica]
MIDKGIRNKLSLLRSKGVKGMEGILQFCSDVSGSENRGGDQSDTAAGSERGDADASGRSPTPSRRVYKRVRFDQIDCRPTIYHPGGIFEEHLRLPPGLLRDPRAQSWGNVFGSRASHHTVKDLSDVSESENRGGDQSDTAAGSERGDADASGRSPTPSRRVRKRVRFDQIDCRPTIYHPGGIFEELLPLPPVRHPNTIAYPEKFFESAQAIAAHNHFRWPYLSREWIRRQQARIARVRHPNMIVAHSHLRWPDLSREWIRRQQARIARVDWESTLPCVPGPRKSRLPLFTRKQQRLLNKAREMDGVPDLSALLRGKLELLSKKSTTVDPQGLSNSGGDGASEGFEGKEEEGRQKEKTKRSVEAEPRPSTSGTNAADTTLVDVVGEDGGTPENLSEERRKTSSREGGSGDEPVANERSAPDSSARKSSRPEGSLEKKRRIEFPDRVEFSYDETTPLILNPLRCAELTRQIRGGTKEMPQLEDLYFRHEYSDDASSRAQCSEVDEDPVGIFREACSGKFEELEGKLKSARVAKKELARENTRLEQATATLEKEKAELLEVRDAAVEKLIRERQRLKDSRGLEVTRERERVEAAMAEKANRCLGRVRDHFTRLDAFGKAKNLYGQASGTKKCLEMIKANGTEIPQEMIDVFAEQEKLHEAEATQLSVGPLSDSDLTLSPLVLPSRFVEDRFRASFDPYGSNEPSEEPLVDVTSIPAEHVEIPEGGGLEERPENENLEEVPEKDNLETGDTPVRGEETKNVGIEGPVLVSDFSSEGREDEEEEDDRAEETSPPQPVEEETTNEVGDRDVRNPPPPTVDPLVPVPTRVEDPAAAATEDAVGPPTLGTPEEDDQDSTYFHFVVRHPNTIAYPEKFFESAQAIAAHSHLRWPDLSREWIRRQQARIARVDWGSRLPCVLDPRKSHLPLFTRKQQRLLNKAREMDGVPDLSALLKGKLQLLSKKSTTVDPQGPSNSGGDGASEVDGGVGVETSASGPKKKKKSKKTKGRATDEVPPEESASLDATSEEGREGALVEAAPDGRPKKRTKSSVEAEPRPSTFDTNAADTTLVDVVGEDNDTPENLSEERRKTSSREGGSGDEPVANERSAPDSSARKSSRPEGSLAKKRRIEFPDREMPQLEDLYFRDEYIDAASSRGRSDMSVNFLVEKYDSALKQTMIQLGSSEKLAQARLKAIERFVTRIRSPTLRSSLRVLKRSRRIVIFVGRISVESGYVASKLGSLELIGSRGFLVFSVPKKSTAVDPQGPSNSGGDGASEGGGTSREGASKEGASREGAPIVVEEGVGADTSASGPKKKKKSKKTKGRATGEVPPEESASLDATSEGSKAKKKKDGKKRSRGRAASSVDRDEGLAEGREGALVEAAPDGRPKKRTKRSVEAETRPSTSDTNAADTTLVDVVGEDSGTPENLSEERRKTSSREGGSAPDSSARKSSRPEGSLAKKRRIEFPDRVEFSYDETIPLILNLLRCAELAHQILGGTKEMPQLEDLYFRDEYIDAASSRARVTALPFIIYLLVDLLGSSISHSPCLSFCRVTGA